MAKEQTNRSDGALPDAASWIGRRVRRVEDPKLVRGRGSYVDDVPVTNPLHLVLVRSQQAHALLERVDVERAKGQDGIVAVLTGDDVAGVPDAPANAPKGATAVRHPVLARGVVKYVGQPVAAVLAETRAAAEDAAELVGVEYRPLPVVADLKAAAAGDVMVHEGVPGNVAYTKLLQEGDVPGAFERADRVVKVDMINQRLAGVPLEGRGTLAAFDGTRDTLTVWSSTQMPHDLRDRLAELLCLAETQVRVIAPDVGGGFGIKINVYPEDVLVAALARQHRRPVKWIESRHEHMLSAAHGRGQQASLEAAVTADGKVLALRGRILADLGAFALTTTANVPTSTLSMLQGPYEVVNFDVELTELYSNKTPTGAYRGAGRPEPTYYLERLMDVVARDLGLDPAEVRRRNFISEDAFPYKTVTGTRYDSGAYERALDVALEKSGYADLREEQQRLRTQGRYLGIGLASYVEICAFGWDQARVRVNRDGSAMVFTGTSPHGQGAATGFAQIVAEQLGIEPTSVQVVHGDTLAVPTGQGTAGSRTLVVGGSAIQRAAERIRIKLLKIAAHQLGVSEEQLVMENGQVLVEGAPETALSVRDIADLAHRPNKLPDGLEPGLEEQATFYVKNATFPFGTHVCVVEVDRSTGAASIVRYVSVDDCGSIMNPMLVEGQVHGGIAQGAGQALWEGVAFDAAGQNMTASLAEYALPRLTDFPSFELQRTVTPSPTNPLGAKGVGEAGTIGATPAVVNAVIDALEAFGVRHLDMPLTAPKVWQAMQASAREDQP